MPYNPGATLECLRGPQSETGEDSDSVLSGFPLIAVSPQHRSPALLIDQDPKHFKDIE